MKAQDQDLTKLKYSPYSASKIAMYQQCPRKFKYSYIDKIPAPWTDSLATQRGKFLHLLMEHSGNIQKVKASKDWEEIQEIGILHPGHLKDCVRIYQDFTSSDIGQSLLNKEMIFAEQKVGLDHNFEFMDFDKYVKTENQPDELVFRGFMDAGFVQDSANPASTLIIVDWKSGKYKHYKYDQLMWYAIAMFKMNPALENIVLMYAFLEHNKTQMTKLTRADLHKYETALLTEIDEIEKDQTFEVNVSPLCNWCAFQEHCTSDCAY